MLNLTTLETRRIRGDLNKYYRFSRVLNIFILGGFYDIRTLSMGL